MTTNSTKINAKRKIRVGWNDKFSVVGFRRQVIYLPQRYLLTEWSNFFISYNCKETYTNFRNQWWLGIYALRLKFLLHLRFLFLHIWHVIWIGGSPLHSNLPGSKIALKTYRYCIFVQSRQFLNLTLINRNRLSQFYYSSGHFKFPLERLIPIGFLV